MNHDRDYKKLLVRIAGNIKELRLSRGWTQEDMIDHGFNYRQYQHFESGRYSPSLKTLQRLARVFKVDISDLLAPKGS